MQSKIAGILDIVDDASILNEEIVKALLKLGLCKTLISIGTKTYTFCVTPVHTSHAFFTSKRENVSTTHGKDKRNNLSCSCRGRQRSPNHTALAQAPQGYFTIAV